MKTLPQLIGVVIFLALIVFAASQHSAAERTNELFAWFFDVGQGDSILLDTPDHHQILIDGGPDQTVLQRLAEALPLSDKEIDLVISTHNDADHLSGLNDVLRHYKIDKIWLTGALHTTKTFQTFIELIKEKAIPVQFVIAGSRVEFDELSGIVISPLQSYQGVTPTQQNATGIVTFWQFGQETLLLTADIEQPQEQAIIDHGLLRPVDILKVAHHGSKTSSSEVFLKIAMPKIAVISLGKNNRYGHPHQEVLERFTQLNIPVLRTDERGTVKFLIWPDHFSYAHP